MGVLSNLKARVESAYNRIEPSVNKELHAMFGELITYIQSKLPEAEAEIVKEAPKVAAEVAEVVTKL